MSEISKIEWTESTWNPVTGCTKISPGCKNCYAQTFAERFRNVDGHPYQQGFDITLRPERLNLPLRWKKPKMIFVNSMSDLFLQEIPDEYIDKVFVSMESADRHTFQVLTKRAERMVDWTSKKYGIDESMLPANIWIGVSVEDENYNYRIELLQKIPASIKFISFEPLLGSVNLTSEHLKGIDWVIVGGESGPKARKMQKEWIDNIFQTCQEAGVPFFFKQWGAFDSEGKKVGKKKAGRLYLGRTWDEKPS